MTEVKDNQLQLNRQSIETELKTYKKEPLKMIAEYIRNSFDAKAKKVEILFWKQNEEVEAMYAPTELIIKDDGDGWSFESNETQYFLSSSKKSNDDQRTTLPHWKLWRWRYSFVWFADSLEAKSGNKIMTLDCDTNIKVENCDDFTNGTQVKLINIKTDLLTSLWTDLEKFLRLEFWRFLKWNPNLSIEINGIPLNLKFIIKNEETLDKTVFSEALQRSLNDYDLTFKIVLRNEKPKEYSRFFMFKEEGSDEIFTKTTGFNKQSDNFWHSVYIYSPIFETSDIDENYNDDETLPLDVSANKKTKQKIFREIKFQLSNIRRPLLEANSKKVIENLHSEASMPDLDFYWIYDKEWFESLLQEAYVIAPNLFSANSPSERKFVCNTFAALLSSQDENLIKKFIQQVFTLEQQEKDKLEELLDRTDLASIVRTVAEVQSRLDVIADLEALLFEYEKETLEVVHLQQVLNKNPWIFGEQFRLFTDTEWALKTTLYKYAQEVLEIEDPTITSTSKKELDLFLVKTSAETESIRKNIVVEIKRPSVTLWKKEYDQIELYANKILEESVCNDPNTYREFYLIWNDFNSDIERKIETSKPHWEEHRWLTENTLDWRRKIYVRKRSSVIWVEHKYKLQYLAEKLKLQSKEIASNPTEIVSLYTQDKS